MPKVGMKNFSYDETGYQKAMQEAQRTGFTVRSSYPRTRQVIRYAALPA